MAQLVNAPTKYSTFEWHKSNNKNYSSAETERASAERLQSESKRLTDETDEITRFTQEDVNKKLAQRLRELNFWKDEVSKFCIFVLQLSNIHQKCIKTLIIPIRKYVSFN